MCESDSLILTSPDPARLKFLDDAHTQGVNFWDTADVYASFYLQSGKCRDMFLATKFGIQQHPGQPSGIHNDPEYVQHAYLQSRARLGLAADDPIDLYYCHRIDPNQPIELTVQAIASLVHDGLVNYLGLTVQIQLSPFAVDSMRNGLLTACQGLGVSVTGKLRNPDGFPDNDRRRILPQFSPVNFRNNSAIVEILEHMASQKGLPGTTKLENLKENLGSLGFHVTEEDIEAINSVIDTAAVQ
ncbi:NADP-dependent oxidoreductase domain-containing protein [Aspergillus californicus]